MKQFSKLMLLALGLGILALVVSSVSSQPVAAAPGGGGPTVTVDNTAANPIPVSSINTRNAFSARVFCSVNAFNNCRTDFFTSNVPSNWIGVVQDVSADCHLSPGNTPGFVTLIAPAINSAPNVNVLVTLPLVDTGANDFQGHEIYANPGRQLTMYLPAGSNPAFFAQTIAPGASGDSCSMSISGYYERTGP